MQIGLGRQLVVEMVLRVAAANQGGTLAHADVW
jgi:hypothetical protein